MTESIRADDIGEDQRVSIHVYGEDNELHRELVRYFEEKLDSAKDMVELRNEISQRYD